MHDTVTIQILGQEYKVKAGGNIDHIQSLSRYINDKICDVQQKGMAVTTTELVAMVMLNMADDVAKTRDELAIVKRSVTDKIDSLIEYIDKTTR